MATSAPPKPNAGKSTGGTPQSHFDREFAGITSPGNFSKNAEEPHTKSGSSKNPNMTQALQRGVSDAGKVGKAANSAAQTASNPSSLADPSKLRRFATGVGKARQAGRDYKKTVKERAKDQAKKQVKRVAKKAARTVAKDLAAETFGLSVVVVEAVIHWKWVLYAAIGVILFVVVILGGDSAATDLYQQQQAAQQAAQQQTQDNEPTVTETCNPQTLAKSGQTTTCTITVTYAGSADDIQVIDTIISLSGSDYVAGSSSPPAAFDDSTGTLLWDAKQLKLQLNPINFKVSFKLTSTKDNWTIYNSYSITPTGLSSGSSSGCGNFNKSATTFDALMTGQGRCTNVMGSESNFITTLEKNGPNFNFTGRESDLKAIYETAVSHNVNPVILVTIWGVESSFGTVAGENFNCGNFQAPFATSLDCAVNTLNNFMTYFDQQKTKPVAITPNCKYNDPFLYAYEKYTPVCAINDNNGNARTNFVNYYKQLLGV